MTAITSVPFRVRSAMLCAALLVGACGGKVEPGTASDAGNTATDGGVVAPDGDGGVIPQTPDASVPEEFLDFPAEPTGAAALAQFERLAYLKHGAHALSYSSADPRGGNNDKNNYLAVRPNGEQVMFDAKGPGVIYRFWSTRAPNVGGTYRFYFDGETTPRLTVGRDPFGNATVAPFTPPLSIPRAASSGGYTTYFPIGFAQSLVITSTGGIDPDFYNFNFMRYSNDAKVTTFTGQEDTAAVRSAWANPGRNPIPAQPTDVVASGVLEVAPSSTGTVVELTGGRQIVELRFNSSATDNGRAHKGSSSFRMSVDPQNTGVRLVRRTDHSVANQKANVLVDGALAGTWTDAGNDLVNIWRNTQFEIPASFTAGKSSIAVTIQFVSSVIDWNEFTYWAYSQTAAGPKLTDTLDVGTVASEQAHQYAISGQTFEGTKTFRYVGAHRGRIQITFDDQPTPAVDAPGAEFFGTYAARDANVRSLPVGHNAGDFYSFFPMPFAKSARIAINNPGGEPIQGTWSVTHRPFTDDIRRVGYFHATYNSVPRTLLGKDFLVLETSGSGHYAGMNLITPSRNYTLEGDERFFIDGARTPSIHGTGTEDYFNGGWYYDGGAYQTPTYGAPFMPALCVDNPATCTPFSQYRFHVGDVVPFSASLRVSIEHAAVNDNTEPYSAVAYYYLNPRQLLAQTDQIKVGDSASESAHAYVAEKVASTQPLAARFEGDNGEQLTRPSRALQKDGTVSFTVAVNPKNQGVTLRRLFDVKDGGQSAEVFVDGESVGVWSTPGHNEFLRWREEDFWIPRRFTQNKEQLQLRLVVKSAVWNESEYAVLVSKH